MWNSLEQQALAPLLPTTLRFCKVCGEQTPHQVRTGAGVVATICIPCMERTLQYELDRD
jgi:hypothetical protein